MKVHTEETAVSTAPTMMVRATGLVKRLSTALALACWPGSAPAPGSRDVFGSGPPSTGSSIGPEPLLIAPSPLAAPGHHERPRGGRPMAEPQGRVLERLA